jgi:cobalt-zinc-cadmium efflux system outer membrane protein
MREGMASTVEAARARAPIAIAQAELARTRSGLDAARATLAATWGGTPAEVGPVRGRIRVPETLPDEEAFRSTLLLHPRVELQRARVEARRAVVELEQAQAVQDITIGGGVRFLRQGTDAAFVAGVSLPLPVRNQNQGNVRAAREALAAAEQTARAVETELRVAFLAAWQQLQTAHATASNLRRDALPPAEEAHAVVRRAYAEGQLPLIDVLDAQRALAALQREIFDAETAYAIALVQVEGITDPAFPATAALLSPE